jgi:hypothetical protein
MSTFDLAEANAILARTPAILDAWLRGLPEPWLDVRPEGPESFSPRDVLGHLIGGERTDWIGRSRMILERGESAVFEPFDRVGFKREIAGKRLEELLDLFATLRRENLATLATWRLTPADLTKRGRHPDFGVVTLEQLLATWVAHDLGHLGQVARVMAKRYGDEVGPWARYLPILSR